MDARPTQQHRFILSQDGMSAAWIHPMDPANPKHTGWTDCTDLDDATFQSLVSQRQSAPRIVSLAVAA